jgi:hypothetical protein
MCVVRMPWCPLDASPVYIVYLYITCELNIIFMLSQLSLHSYRWKLGSSLSPSIDKNKKQNKMIGPVKQELNKVSKSHLQRSYTINILHVDPINLGSLRNNIIQFNNLDQRYHIFYENIFHDVSNDIDFVIYMLIVYSKNLVKLCIVWLLKKIMTYSLEQRSTIYYKNILPPSKNKWCEFV